MWIKKPEFIFIIFAFIFGLIMMFVTPPYLVPDEAAHLMRACEVADGILYNKTPAQDVECDKYIQKGMNFQRLEAMHQCTGYSPVMYAFSALGLKAGMFWGGKVMFYFGRFVNLLVWIIFTALAIRITPVFKFPFLFCSLMPMTLYEGMSLSADSFNNGFAFLFTAYIFKLIFEKKDVSKKDIILLSVMTLISAFTKGAIFPVFLFYFLPMKKYKTVFATLMLIAAFSLMTLWSSINMTFVNPDVNIEFNKYLFIHKPWHFLSLYAKSIINSGYYMNSCVGILGWLNIRLKPFFYFPTLLIFMSMFIFLREEKVTNKMRVCALFVLTVFITLLHVYYYLIWTVPDSDRIHGIQGRYFIPVLPFVFLILAQSKKYFSDKIVDLYKIFLICYIFYMQIFANVILFKTF